MAVGIWGIGSYVPKNRVTNDDLADRMETSDEWIRTRTGIEARHFAEDTEETSDMAYEAAKNALNDANLDATELDLILVATVTPDQPFPTVANMLQDRLGATNAASMDVSAACAGFMYAMITGSQFIQTNTYKHVLIVGVEKLSKIIDWEDRSTAVLFGDGAGAVVLGQVNEGKGILSFELGSDGSGGKHLSQQGKYIQMNGREVFKFAVRQMGESALNVLEKACLTKEDVDFLVPHQANIRIMESARERLQLPQEKMSKTIHLYGNTSAASIPLSLDYEIKNNKVKDGDVLVLVGFGGGLTWGAIALRYGK